MSEFPEWLECELGFDLSYERSLELHAALDSGELTEANVREWLDRFESVGLPSPVTGEE